MTHNKLNIFLYFVRKYQWRTGVLLLIQFFIGFLEGVGIAALLPLITIMVEGTQQTESPLYAMVAGLFSAIHLDLKLETVLLVIVVIFGLKAVLKFFGSWYVAYLGPKVVHDMRTDLLDALLHSRWSFYVQRPVGMFVNSLMVESQRSGGAFRTMIDMIAAFLQMGLLLFIASLAAWEVVAIAALTGAFLWVALYRYIVITGKTSIAQKDLSRSISSQITDVLQNYKPLKAMRIEDGVFKRMEKDITLLFDVSREQIMAKQKMEIMYEPIFVVILSAGLYGALTYLAIAPAVLMVMAALFYRIITAARELQQSVQVLSGQESFFWALHDFTQEAKTARENYVEGRKHVLGKEISFEGVSFAYDHKPILSDLNLHIPAKKLVGIHGPSGTGKTTLIDLLCRLYTPDGGRILVDGLPLEEIDLHYWRGSVGYVPQEFVVFNDTILGNLTFGNPEITEAQVIEALKKAEAWGFIEGMPEGLNTNLGERGGRLSGGQRQRISIARALVRNPSLLILDEATASLDPVTEKEIYKTLKDLSKDMTIIAISHQNTMKEQADLVIDLAQL